MNEVERERATRDGRIHALVKLYRPAPADRELQIDMSALDVERRRSNLVKYLLPVTLATAEQHALTCRTMAAGGDLSLCVQCVRFRFAVGALLEYVSQERPGQVDCDAVSKQLDRAADGYDWHAAAGDGRHTCRLAAEHLGSMSSSPDLPMHKCRCGVTFHPFALKPKEAAK